MARVTIIIAVIYIFIVFALAFNAANEYLSKVYVQKTKAFQSSQVEKLMKYHGTLHTFIEKNQLYFYRHGKKCRLWNPFRTATNSKEQKNKFKYN